MKGRQRAVLAVVGAVTFVVAGGIAYAGIPDAGTGKYHACMKSNGTIRVIDPAVDACMPGIEKEITFNQQGPKGDPGTPGTPGAPGAPGASPTVQQLSTGDTHCPAGGAAITDANGSTAYVCSGQPFSGTFTSPNGQYKISVLDTGVTVSGPSGRITVAGTDITIDHADNISLRASSDVSIGAGLDLTARAGDNASLVGSGNTEVRAGGELGIDGAFVTVNGPSCSLAARLGDSIFGSADSGGTVTGNVITGSNSVCIG